MDEEYLIVKEVEIIIENIILYSFFFRYFTMMSKKSCYWSLLKLRCCCPMPRLWN
jgi:hypothetical protein